MASWAKDWVSAWQRDTVRVLRRCVYCGEVIRYRPGKTTCEYCRDLLKHDPQAKR